jgi:hypothetical protein
VRALFYLVTNEAVKRDGVYLDDIGVWGEPFTAVKAAPANQALTAAAMPIFAGGATATATSGGSATPQSGYAVAEVSSGGTPYGIAVLSLTQKDVVVSEAAVTSAPPTTSARIFIDCRNGVVPAPAESGTGTVDISTGLALVNRGSTPANVTYTLRSPAGLPLASGHGSLAAGAHAARFIHQLNEVAPDFTFPPDFASATRFGSLEVGSDQPLSITALRLTENQRGDLLLTGTPVANTAAALGISPLYFPQFVDGGGYATTINLLNTSNTLETGTITFWGDDGSALAVGAEGGARGSSFNYSIQPGGVYVLQTTGASAGILAGSVQVTPSLGTTSPAGAGIFSYSSGGIRTTESAVPAAVPTTHARIYIDESAGHDTGLAVASPSGSTTHVSFKAYQADGNTTAGGTAATISLNGKGHVARFVGQLISGLPAGFTGVLDVSAPSPFVAVTLRSLKNARGDLLLTTFPVADLNASAPAPVVFPHIAAGGGYTTQFVLLSSGAASGAILRFLDDKGFPLPVGK